MSYSPRRMPTAFSAKSPMRLPMSAYIADNSPKHRRPMTILATQNRKSVDIGDPVPRASHATRNPGTPSERWPGKQKVELRGFEPLTSSMPWKRATNCAIAPNKRQLYAGASKGGKSGRRAPGHSGRETAARRQRLRHSGPSAAAQTQQYGHSNPSTAQRQPLEHDRP